MSPQVDELLANAERLYHAGRPEDARAAGFIEFARRQASLRLGDDGRPVAGPVMLLQKTMIENGG